MVKKDLGKKMYELATELFPLPRSITGDGTRQTLRILKREVPELKMHEVPSGEKVLDWTVPLEWNIYEAYIISPEGDKIVDFTNNNLHVVGYSAPIDAVISLDDLKRHLHTLPSQPKAIPYVVSYYKKTWGFCITHNQFQLLKSGDYHVKIKSTLRQGSLTYGEVVLTGKSKKEVFISTYVCHPSMANNELSGPVVTIELIKYLKSLKERRYTYRIIFIPETIGSITYISRHIKHLKKYVKAGFNMTCVGDNRAYSYMPSRRGDTLSDRISKHVLMHLHPEYKAYSFLSRGSDERQYCHPRVDLPMVSIMRSKYHEYPEYHTSLDNLDLISSEGLYGAYNVNKVCLECIESNIILQNSIIGEPHLRPRGVYPTLGARQRESSVSTMMDLIAYCDGKRDLLSIAEEIRKPIWELTPIVNLLLKEKILEEVDILLDRKLLSDKSD
jgi:aminopeptidase-like protein